MIILSTLFLMVSAYADNTIHLNLADHSGVQKLPIKFDIVLPKGQKLNMGAGSNFKVKEKIGAKWSLLSEIDLSKKVGFFGGVDPFEESFSLSKASNAVRIEGTLYHCPKAGVKKGKDNICIIQNLEGESKRNPAGSPFISAKVKATMDL